MIAYYVTTPFNLIFMYFTSLTQVYYIVGIISISADSQASICRSMQYIDLSYD